MGRADIHPSGTDPVAARFALYIPAMVGPARERDCPRLRPTEGHCRAMPAPSRSQLPLPSPSACRPRKGSTVSADDFRTLCRASLTETSRLPRWPVAILMGVVLPRCVARLSSSCERGRRVPSAIWCTAIFSKLSRASIVSAASSATTSAPAASASSKRSRLAPAAT